MTPTAQIIDDNFLFINGKHVGFLKSRHLHHVNRPSANKSRMATFFEFDKEDLKYGKRTDLDAPALIVVRDGSGGTTETVNPAIISKINEILA